MVGKDAGRVQDKTADLSLSPESYVKLALSEKSTLVISFYKIMRPTKSSITKIIIIMISSVVVDLANKY